MLVVPRRRLRNWTEMGTSPWRLRTPVEAGDRASGWTWVHQLHDEAAEQAANGSMWSADPGGVRPAERSGAVSCELRSGEMHLDSAGAALGRNEGNASTGSVAHA